MAAKPLAGNLCLPRLLPPVACKRPGGALTDHVALEPTMTVIPTPHAKILRETFAYRGAEWHRKAANGTGFLYDSVPGVGNPMATAPDSSANVIADISGAGVSRFYVSPALDEYVSMTVTGGTPTTYYYSQDERRSVRTLTTSTGAVANRYDYTAFGEPWAAGTCETVAQRYTHTGRELNSYSGNFYFRYRTYGAGIGVFLMRDPATSRSGGFLYGGVQAHPDGRDPLGLDDSIIIGPSDPGQFIPPPPGLGLVRIGNTRGVRVVPVVPTEPCCCNPGAQPWVQVDVTTAMVAPSRAQASVTATLLEVNTARCTYDVKWAWYTCQRKGGRDGFFPNGLNAGFDYDVGHSTYIADLFVVVTYCDISKRDAKGYGRVRRDFHVFAFGVHGQLPIVGQGGLPTWEKKSGRITWQPWSG